MTQDPHTSAGPHAMPTPPVSLFVYATGSIGCWNLPLWLMFLQQHHPEVTVRVGLSRTAATFVSPRTLTATTGSAPFLDVWDDPHRHDDTSPHTRLVREHDAFVVHPATMDVLSRLAAGSGETPVLTALQMTDAPVAIAPALPPGAQHSRAVQRNLALLREDPRFAVAPMTTTTSASDGTDSETGPPPLSEVVELVLARLDTRTPAGRRP